MEETVGAMTPPTAVIPTAFVMPATAVPAGAGEVVNVGTSNSEDRLHVPAIAGEEVNVGTANGEGGLQSVPTEVESDAFRVAEHRVVVSGIPYARCGKRCIYSENDRVCSAIPGDATLAEGIREHSEEGSGSPLEGRQ